MEVSKCELCGEPMPEGESVFSFHGYSGPCPKPPLPKEPPAKTERELELEDLLRSARCIAQRKGENTAWETFDRRLAECGIGSVTPRVFKILRD